MNCNGGIGNMEDPAHGRPTDETSELGRLTLPRTRKQDTCEIKEASSPDKRKKQELAKRE